MNSKELAEYILENSHDDKDSKVVAKAYLDLLAKQEGLVMVPRGCCMSCKYWRYTMYGEGECRIFYRWTKEDFYCKRFTTKAEEE